MVMNIIQTIVTIMFLLLWLALAYKPWFRPKEYVDMQKKRRARLKGK